MESKEEPPELLATKELTNGIILKFYDRSRVIAGDRWQVELVCEADIPVSEEMWERLRPEDPDILQGIKKSLSNTLVYSLTKIKPFVDAGDKQGALDEFARQIEENMESYLANPDFPQRVFAREYERAREKLLLAQAQEARQDPESEPDEDGPADFSNCFKKS